MASPYSCDPTGVIDCAASIESIKANQSNVGTVFIPRGTFSIVTNLTIPVGMKLRFEAGATFAIATAVTLTINGTLDAGPYQIFSCTGTGKVVFGVGAVTEVYPKWWGAVADGTTDCSAAIQAAIDSIGLVGSMVVKPVVFGPGSYKINTCLNLTNTRVGGTLQRDSIWFKGTGYYSGTKIVANTGTLALDACGAGFLKLTDITIDSTVAGLSNPSVVGLFCAPNTTLDQCQSHYYENLTILMHDDAAANGGEGTIALVNFGAEDHTYNACWFQANRPITITGAKAYIWGVDSVYQTTPASHSMTSLRTIGDNFFITVNRRKTAITIADASAIDINGSIFNLGTGGSNDEAIFVGGTIYGFTFNGVVENLGTFMDLHGTIKGARINATISNVLNATAPVMHIEPGGSAGIITDAEIVFTLGSSLTRSLIIVYGPPAVGDSITSYLANTTIKTNQTKAYCNLNQNLLANANTRNVKIQGADHNFEVGLCTQDIQIPPTTVGTVGGSVGANVCKITMPGIVVGSSARSIGLEMSGTLFVYDGNTNAMVTQPISVQQAIATLNSDGTITISDSDGAVGGNQANITISTRAAVNAAKIDITLVRVDATATGVASVAFSVVPTLVGTNTGAPVAFSGRAKITWIGAGTQAPLLTLP